MTSQDDFIALQVQPGAVSQVESGLIPVGVIIRGTEIFVVLWRNALGGQHVCPQCPTCADVPQPVVPVAPAVAPSDLVVEDGQEKEINA